MLLSYAVYQLHDQYSLANTGTTEQANFSSSGERAKQVDGFYACLQHFGLSLLINKGRRIPMNRPVLFSFNLRLIIDRLTQNIDHAAQNLLREVIERFQRLAGDAWPCWAISNHDVERSASRWGAGEDPVAYPAVMLAMLFSLRGSVCLYQGEELGLPEAEVPFERIQDPYGKVLWPAFKGRDGCRTPMPWENSANGGFTAPGVEPWLPVEARHLPLSVARQEDDSASVLNATRRLLAFRARHPALFDGELRLVDVGDALLGFVRERAGERILCLFNLTAEPRETRLPLAVDHALEGHGFTASLDGDTLRLPAYQAAWFAVS